MKARLIRRKPKKAIPPTPQDKKPTEEQIVTAGLKSVFAKYKGKKPTVSLARNLVSDINKVITDACSIEPTWQSRVAELNKQLAKRALYIPHSGASPFDGIVFVENVGIVDDSRHDTIAISGIYAIFGNDHKFSYVKLTLLRYPIGSSCVRNGKFRTFVNGAYVTCDILDRTKYQDFLKCAKIALCRVDRALDKF